MPTSIRYQIQCDKDGEDVKATYDLTVPVGGPALIASFRLTVDGKDLIDQDKWIADKPNGPYAVWRYSFARRDVRNRHKYPSDKSRITGSTQTS